MEEPKFDCGYPLFKFIGCKWFDCTTCADCEYSSVKEEILNEENNKL